MKNQRVKTECDYCGESLVRYQSKSGKHFCDISHKSSWQKLQREKLGYTKEWLINEYIKKGKSCNQIARAIKRDPKRVWEWVIDYGIPTRKRGSDYGQLLKKGNTLFKGRHHSDETKKKLSEAQAKNSAWRGKFGKDHPRFGVRSPNWRGGLSPLRQLLYRTQKWKECVKYVWKRDDATCQICKLRKNESKKTVFDIHHIVPFEHEKYRFDGDNLVLLCRKCHIWTHSNKNKDKKLIGGLKNENT